MYPDVTPPKLDFMILDRVYLSPPCLSRFLNVLLKSTSFSFFTLTYITRRILRARERGSVEGSR